MDIRLAKKDDLEQINVIYNQAIMKGFCTAHLEEVDITHTALWFGTHDPKRFPVFVACEEDLVLGWISLSPYRQGRQALEHVGEVSYFVHEDHRGKGTGKSLMAHVLETAPSYGLDVLVAILLGDNDASIALLRKFNFELWGIMPGIARIGSRRSDHVYYGIELKPD